MNAAGWVLEFSTRALPAGSKHDEFEGIRVSPSVYTTPAELDRFCDAMESAIDNGVPA